MRLACWSYPCSPSLDGGLGGTVDGFAYRAVVVGTEGVARLPRERQLRQLQVRVRTQDYVFARMLAKIAWGQPVAEWGRAAFQKVFILDGILGVKQDMGKFGLVGRSLRVLPSPQVKLPQQRHPVCQGVLPGS